MRAAAASLALALCACAHGREAGPPALAGWSSGHPIAATELCTFSRTYPTDANRLREWARSHPALAAQLLDLAAANGAWKASAFLSSQREWDGYSPARDPALYQLLDWANHRPEAAHALADTPRGTERAMDGGSCAKPAGSE